MKIGSIVAWNTQLQRQGGVNHLQIDDRLIEHGVGPFKVINIEEFLGPGSRLIQFRNEAGNLALINESWLIEI